MKVLLTGHKGYIGSVAASMLLNAGHTVTGLDTCFFEPCLFTAPADELPELRKDLRDLVPSDVAGFEAVIHLAALSNDPLGNFNPDLTYDINHRASVRLAAAAKAAGASLFVFASSCSTYGAAGDEYLDEGAELSPVTAYAESKVMVERDVAGMASDSFTPVFMRNATAYGSSPRLRQDIVLNDLVASAYATRRIYLKSDGTPWRPIVHVEDIVAAMLAVLEAPRTVVHNQVFNVGSTVENYRISELAEIVAEVVPGCTIEYAPGGGPDKRCYRVDFGKISSLLPAFRPRWNARLGARQLYDDYVRTGFSAADLAGSRFIRIARIRDLMAEGLLDLSLRWTSEQTAQTRLVLAQASAN